jgi:hypothetical protein
MDWAWSISEINEIAITRYTTCGYRKLAMCLRLPLVGVEDSRLHYGFPF